MVPVGGVVTSWAVRGARGTLALQVLYRSELGLVEADRSSDADVRDTGLHVIPARMEVAAGDRVALVVSPDAAVGLRRGGPAATIERWIGPLFDPARPPEQPAGTGLDRELLLRVDVRPGPTALTPLRGAAAARAPAGRRLATRTVAVGGGETRSVAVVVVGETVALDLFAGARRRARLTLRGADADGSLGAIRVRGRSVLLFWREADGSVLERGAAVSADRLS